MSNIPKPHTNEYINFLLINALKNLSSEQLATLHNSIGKRLSNTVTLTGWVARHKVGNLCMCVGKQPIRNMGWWESYKSLTINDSLFPSLTWEDEPVEVEINIKINEETE